MKKSNITPVNRPRAFDITELFFSTTDRRGVITGCNDVFVNISGYESQDLLGEPHNIIRHPDMPRCVFKLLWDYLLAGKSIGAYVKNMAATGEYYWVFALVMPVNGELLSVRLKPSSHVFTTIESLYKDLLAQEASYNSDWRTGMHIAGETLGHTLTTLGFASYDEFMSYALREELQSRTKAVVNSNSASKNSEVLRVFNEVSNLISLQKMLTSRVSFFGGLGKEITRLAINASIVADRLGEGGKALSVIGSEVSNVAKQISEESSKFKQEVNVLYTTINRVSFMTAFCALLSEMLHFFDASQKDSRLDLNEQIHYFGGTYAHHTETLTSSLCQGISQCYTDILTLNSAIDNFNLFCQEFAKILLNLQLGYVTGKSIAISTDEDGRFSLLLDSLFRLSQEARVQLEELKRAVNQGSSHVANWKQSETFQSHA